MLDRLIEERGRPENVRSDNGPEFTSRRIIGWAEERKVELVHLQPGRPMQNGHVESFHSRLREECLNTAWFRTLGDVRQKLADWQQEYNTERPHSSLDYRTPEEFKRACDESRDMALLSSQTSTQRNYSYEWWREWEQVRVMRIQQRHQLWPRHHAFHLLKKLRMPRLPTKTLKPSSQRQRLLLHRQHLKHGII